MGFVPSETEESFKYILQKFRSTFQVSLGIGVVSQNAEVIGAIPTLLPNTFITLQDWHPNKNQLKNVAA